MSPIADQSGHDLQATEEDEFDRFSGAENRACPNPRETARWLTGSRVLHKGCRAENSHQVDDEPGLITYNRAILVAFGLIVLAVVSAIVGNLKLSPKVRPFWSILDASLQKRPVGLNLYQDPSAWLLYLLIISLPILLIRGCRHVERLCDQIDEDRIDKTQRQDLFSMFKIVEKHWKLMGSKISTIVLLVFSGYSAYSVLQSVLSIGPWAGILRSNVPVSRDIWWLSRTQDKPGYFVCLAMLTAGIYFLLKMLAIIAGTIRILGFLSRIHLPVDIDEGNQDGHFGLLIYRKLLFDAASLGGIVVTITALVGLLWCGFHSGTVASTTLVAVISIAAVAVLMLLISDGIEGGKRSSLAVIVERVSNIDHQIFRLQGNAGDSTISNLLEYRLHLIRKRDEIQSIPKTGFRIREFVVSATSLLVIPTLLIIVSALVAK